MSVVQSDMHKINVRLGNIILVKDAQLLQCNNFMYHWIVNIIFIILKRRSHMFLTLFFYSTG